MVRESENCSDSDEENNLKIVIESPNIDKCKAKNSLEKGTNESTGKEHVPNTPDDKKESTQENTEGDSESETDIERILKAFSDDRVLSLVKEIISPNHGENIKEKLTRAKRRLLLNEYEPPLSWIKTTPPPVEIQQLITEDLQEDSSGDEYVPTNDDIPSEDDEPCTPKSIDNATQTSWTDDGLFKIPLSLQEKEEETLNIALRTRSKVSLTSTPLEVIAEAFIPPDLTTDMYDLDCDDDDVWKDFLKTFARPIDEIEKAPEDEEHDPEYNVQEEPVLGDVEDLKGEDDLEVSQDELNALLIELLGDEYDADPKNNEQVENEDGDADLITEDMYSSTAVLPPETEVTDVAEVSPMDVDTTDEENNCDEVYIMVDEHKRILKQQMAQHVQLLAQNYIQTYKHMDYSDMACTFKEYLDNLNNLGNIKENSYFHGVNLTEAFNLIEEWKRKIDENDVDVQKMIQIQNNYTVSSMLVFPKFMLNVMSESKAFIFPKLLPTRPFVPKGELEKIYWHTDSEDHLIAFELDQFSSLVVKTKGTKSAKLQKICKYISAHVMQHRKPTDIYKRVNFASNQKSSSHPIRYYLENGKLSQNFHHRISKKLELIAPSERKCEELPRPWKDHVYPEWTPGVNAHKCSYYIETIEELKRLTRRNTNRILRNPEKKVARDPPRKVERIIIPVKVKPHSYAKNLETCFKTDHNKLDPENSIKTFKFNSLMLKNMDLPSLTIEERTEPVVSSTMNPTCTRIEDCGRKDEQEPSTIDKDNLEDINALMIASSTINNHKRRLSAAESKRKRIRKEYTANLSLLIPEDVQEERDNLNNFVRAFFDKVQERLDVADNNKFMQLLCDFEMDHSPLELVKNINAILTKYPELCEEFLAFLTPNQAHLLGKFVPYFMLTNMTLFLRKLEIYFKDQPSQVKKIYKSLEQLSECLNLTMEKIKTTILPLLKGNALLMEWFLQLFPTEKPPNFLLNGPCENLPLAKGTDTNPAKGTSSEDLFETITIPDVEDPYGGLNCICECHNTHPEDDTYKTRQKHCTPCGTKYLQGRVYLQTGKGLRLANVVFNSPDAQEHYARLGCIYNSTPTTSKKRNDSSPSKNVSTSPNKEPQLEEGRSLSSDDDGIDCKKKLKNNLVKLPRKRKLIPTVTSSTKSTTNANNVNKPTTSTPQETDKQSTSKSSTSTDESKTSNSTEKMDWDCNTSVESMDLRTSPEQVSAADESGSEFCEESSQDNLSDCDGDEIVCDNDNLLSPVHSDNSNSNSVLDDVTWTREEDRIILQTFQVEGNNDETFKRVSNILENRTIEQIRTRFERLIHLLQEMAADTKK